MSWKAPDTRQDAPSRHSQYSHKRLPRQKRTLPLYGEKEDRGIWYRCWNCRFICNIQRDALDQGEHGTSNIAYLDAPEVEETDGSVLTGDPLTTYPILDDRFTLIQDGQDGNPVTTYRHNIYPDISSGCPFCGTKNWR